jgi:RNA polymerase sigma factor (sigma-70 family)
MAESNGNRVLQYLPIVDQEVRRRMALGVPRGVDRSDVQGEAEEALVVAVAKGTTAIRLAVRHALVGLMRYEAVRQRHRGDMPEVEDAPAADRPARAEVTDSSVLIGLKPRQMEAIQLVYYEELSYAEVAEVMNLPVSDVHSLIRAAKENLRRHSKTPSLKRH